MKDLIKQIIDYCKDSNILNNLEKKIDHQQFFDFVELFYFDNKLSDFDNYPIEELAHACYYNFKFVIEAKNSVSKVKISNPKNTSNDGNNKYTFIDIISTDMPFLVDSIVANLDKNGFKIYNIIHPVIKVQRDKDGAFLKIDFNKNKTENFTQESIIQLHISKITNENNLEQIKQNIEQIIQSVDLVVKDFKPMIEMVKQAKEQLNNSVKIINNQEYLTEAKDFLQWLINDNFILLGVNEFSIEQTNKDQYQLNSVSGSAYGMFRSQVLDFIPQVVNSSSQEVNESITKPYIIEILKSRYRSRIHRVANAERIRVQKISPEGKIIGEYRFIGLFTSSAYSSSINTIPLIRKKIEKVITESGFSKGSHNYKDLVSTLESYPRDELFQINEVDLLKCATGIVSICGRSIVKFFAREDKFKRFVSCLIFTPRDRSNSQVRDQIKEILAKSYQGEIADSYVQITESNLIRFHVIIRTNGVIPQIDERKIELEIERMTKIWSDELLYALKIKFDNQNPLENSIALFSKYKNAFSVSYTNRFDAIEASCDISLIEKAIKLNQVVFDLNSPVLKGNNQGEEICELKIFTLTQQIALSEIMPILENFGFNIIQEHTYEVLIEEDKRNRSTQRVWIQYFRLYLTKKGGKLTETIKENFEQTISVIWQKTLENTPFSTLSISCDLNYKQINLLIAYAKYLHQTGYRNSQSIIVEALNSLNNITKNLVKLFSTKFDPTIKKSSSDRLEDLESINRQIQTDLLAVKDVLHDDIIKKILVVINATIRTNFYQKSTNNSDFKGYLSFKFDSSKINHLPLPRPFAEIFVYSTEVEAIHLRGGRVARGGLRWSDRADDFRTEVLGLMKAQMTKNAVIVPVGSKGGFVVKTDLTGFNRDQIQQAGIECYKTFLSGLLDITDNVVNSKIIHPQDVIFYDQADPYLVVAADKGTATFSDIANSISLHYNFWLGDAFASGGSAGYDHKKMGITAKGAWISVMRHFREINIDIQNQDFTCIGIGDLSGDVFGNGMLLSKHTKLVGAFNHLHIFLDPNADPQKSFDERQRMFNLPRSTWMDYNQSLISKGGGIFERSAKSIKLTEEIKKLLELNCDEISPDELIKSMLKAKVDLLWNGGIGTYVKANEETKEEVGDRANDNLRINGNELRCLVVGEGGNLGFTQRGRIEYAINQGRINTDAMDNSAGVDCSDHEVNIKIALTSAMKNGKVDLAQRNIDLESMTNEVSNLVLKDNREQTQAISIAFYQGASLLQDQIQFLDSQEKNGLLNRKIEFLPSPKELEKRQRESIGLTRPELCVMLAYAKMEIYNQLLASDLVNDQYFEKDLLSYFPSLMQNKFREEIINHQLRKEIIATQITNMVVNRIGITFVNQISSQSGFSIPDVVRSLIIAVDTFAIRELWHAIENLDGKISFDIQLRMFLRINKLMERSILWLLRNKNSNDIKSQIKNYHQVVDELYKFLPQVLAQDSSQSMQRKISELTEKKIDKKLAEQIASLDVVASAFDIYTIAKNSELNLEIIAKIYYVIGTRFRLKWLRACVKNLEFDNQKPSKWLRLYSKTLVEDFYFYQMQIAKEIILKLDYKKIKINDVEKIVEDWITNHQFMVARFDNFINELTNDASSDIAMFSIAVNRLKTLVNQ